MHTQCLKYPYSGTEGVQSVFTDVRLSRVAALRLFLQDSSPSRPCFSVSKFIFYGNSNRICILLLCENCINLNSVELVHSAFQAYYVLLLFCIFIFESLLLKL